MSPDYLIIDFDSTFITKESLDELASHVLSRTRADSSVLEKIQQITNDGMSGKISFYESINSRLQLMMANRDDVHVVSKNLKDHVSPSFYRNKDFIYKHHKKIYVVSGGFREMLLPVLMEFGINKEHVFGNKFIYDDKDRVLGFDKKNPLTNLNGKAKIIKSLSLTGEVHAIGDGYNDYQLKASGVVSKFFAFTENIYRKNVCELADKILSSFDDYIEIFDD